MKHREREWEKERQRIYADRAKEQRRIKDLCIKVQMCEVWYDEEKERFPKLRFPDYDSCKA
eukprot:12763062-Alexandrium_andersonii.AAC.1